MYVAAAFAANSLANFLIGLLVAKFLGPEEFGRFAVAWALAVLLNTAGFDWIRLAAVRFYSERVRKDDPAVRATLDAAFALCAVALGAVALLIALSGLDVGLPTSMLLLTAATATALGAYDYWTALARSRFLDSAYVRIVVVKNLVGLALTIGGAWVFGSAKLALAGACISTGGAVATSWKELRDADGGAPAASLAKTYARYSLPFIAASVLLQLIPLGNRIVAGALYGYGEVGQFSLANDIGIRILAALVSALDVVLFQLAVRAAEQFGERAAKAKLADNMVAILAVAAPASAGLWIILPSLEALIVPEAFRGPFAGYLEAMLPGLFAFVMLMYAVGPIFQIAKRTAPLIGAAAVACVVDLALLILLPHSERGAWPAMAQSGGLAAGLGTAIVLAGIVEPVWPRWSRLAAVAASTAAMIAATRVFAGWPPGAATLASQIGLGGAAYGAAALALDVAGVRSALLQLRVGSPVTSR